MARGDADLAHLSRPDRSQLRIENVNPRVSYRPTQGTGPRASAAAVNRHRSRGSNLRAAVDIDEQRLRERTPEASDELGCERGSRYRNCTQRVESAGSPLLEKQDRL